LNISLLQVFTQFEFFPVTETATARLETHVGPVLTYYAVVRLKL